MKYSLFCNEGCIDLNSSTLLKALDSVRDKRPNRMKGMPKISFGISSNPAAYHQRQFKTRRLKL